VERRRSNEVDGIFVSQANDGEPFLLPWMKFSGDVYRMACVGVRRSGTNATLSEAAAAAGLAQMDKLDSMVARRQEIAGRLDEVIGSFAGTRLHQTPTGSTHARHLYTFFVSDGRDDLVRSLHARGVEVQLRYFPLHLTPEWRWRGHRPGECPVAERLWFTEHMNLPCHPGLTDGQVDYLVDAVAASLSETEETTCRTSMSGSTRAV
jgi:perosamine synthetase